jgi:hypothetical protein
MVKEPTLSDIIKDIDIILEEQDKANLEELAELIELLKPPK